MSILYRSYYGTPKLNASSGFPTNCIYSFVRILLNLNEKFNEPIFFLANDAGRETFRTSLDAEYKANRPEAEDDFKAQLPVCFKVAESLNLAVTACPGYEADDLIADAVYEISRTDHQGLIVSQDKDLQQLVSRNVQFFDPFRNKLVDEAGVFERFGVQPPQIPILLAICGDSSDNIKGVPGFGPKNAAKIARSYESVQEFKSALESGADLKLEKILPYKDLVVRNLELIALLPRGCLPGSVFELAKPLKITAEFKEILKELEFKSLLKKYETL